MVRGSGPSRFTPQSPPALTSPANVTGALPPRHRGVYEPGTGSGKPADRRADIWAFSCVLYEMLTGRRAFKGDSVADVLVAVMSHESDVAAASVPSTVAFPIRHCPTGARSI